MKWHYWRLKLRAFSERRTASLATDLSIIRADPSILWTSLTLKLFEDNVLVRELLETKSEGRVLVIDGGGSTRCALVGGNLAVLAQNNGWSGIIVNGCVRDVDEINSCDLGVRALASHLRKSNKKGHGERFVPVHIGGTLIHNGEWLYADSAGILVSKSELST